MWKGEPSVLVYRMQVVHVGIFWSFTSLSSLRPDSKSHRESSYRVREAGPPGRFLPWPEAFLLHGELSLHPTVPTFLHLQWVRAWGSLAHSPPLSNKAKPSQDAWEESHCLMKNE